MLFKCEREQTHTHAHTLAFCDLCSSDDILMVAVPTLPRREMRCEKTQQVVVCLFLQRVSPGGCDCLQQEEPEELPPGEPDGPRPPLHHVPTCHHELPGTGKQPPIMHFSTGPPFLIVSGSILPRKDEKLLKTFGRRTKMPVSQ